MAAFVEHRDRAPALDLRRHEITQQALDRVFDDQRAGEHAAIEQRHMGLEHRGATGLSERSRVHRLAQVARRDESPLGLAAARLRAEQPIFVEAQRMRVGVGQRRGITRALATQRIEPGELHHLGPRGAERTRQPLRLVSIDLARHDLSRQLHQLLVVLDQVQADLLLRDLRITLDRLGLALEFLVAQGPKRRHDGCQKQQHRHQRRQRRETVLPGWRLASPPAADQALAPRRCRRRRL